MEQTRFSRLCAKIVRGASKVSLDGLGTAVGGAWKIFDAWGGIGDALGSLGATLGNLWESWKPFSESFGTPWDTLLAQPQENLGGWIGLD